MSQFQQKRYTILKNYKELKFTHYTYNSYKKLLLHLGIKNVWLGIFMQLINKTSYIVFNKLKQMF